MSPPLTWEQLKRGVTTTRSGDVQLAYDHHKLRLRRAGYSVGQVVCEELAPKWGARQWALTVNPFPYDLAEGIHHYIIWFKPSDARRLTQSRVAMAVRKIWPTATQGIVWKVNPESHRSVLSVPHAHVFVNTRILR